MALSHRIDLNLFQCMRLELWFFMPYRIIQCKVWMDHISLSLVTRTSASNCKWTWEAKALFLLLLICLFVFFFFFLNKSISEQLLFCLDFCCCSMLSVSSSLCEQWNIEENNKGKLAWVRRIIFALLSGSQTLEH